MIKTRARRSVAGLLVSLALAIGFSSAAQAVMISIDPGTPGESFTDRSFAFSDLNGQLADGSTLTLDVVFSPEHLQADGRFSAAVVLNWSSSDPLPGFPILPSGSLTDENGNAIAAPTGVAASSIFSPVSTRHTLRFNGNLFHGVSFSLVLPSASATEVVGGTFELLGVSVNNLRSNLTVLGPAALPEPATIMLFGFSILGLGFAARRRRNTR